MAYVLDADVLIKASRSHYHFDLCPGFWDWIIRKNTSEIVRSVEAVETELLRGDDDLAAWVADLDEKMFVRPSADDAAALTTVSVWANEQEQFSPAAISEFLGGADFFLVAQALAGGHTVVTNEIWSNGTKRIKIPNACVGVGVTCTTPTDMLLRERARFVLATDS